VREHSPIRALIVIPDSIDTPRLASNMECGAMADEIELTLPVDIRQGRAPLWMNAQLAGKRVLDVAGALAMIAILSPLLLATAALVRLSSPGPALFRQKRWGRAGTQFSCWKFRTMYVEQDSLIDPATLKQMQARGVLLKPKNDPRVTPIGSFLRRTSIDELPQLFNVIAGDMSLVGPRPLMLHMLAPYPELREVRGQMRPGITGLWQISARENNETALQMAPYDLAYIRGFNLWTDLRIITLTTAVVFLRRGAY
jgi:lipopolysaccharide/colanic/teichoic acid biosynthesis glycosyltransferase